MSDSKAQRIALLDNELSCPISSETCFSQPGTADRFNALRELVQLAPPPEKRRGVNTHVHTGKSFSAFFSPSAVCWQAAKEGLEFLGINDHYTTAGHEEFRQAAEIVGLKALFSMEAIALDEDFRHQKMLLNDPDNPGRTYFTAKGVTRYPSEDDPAMQRLTEVNKALESRHQQMVAKAAAWLEEKTADCRDLRTIKDFGWQDVVGRTPHGNVTERHIAGAIADQLLSAAILPQHEDGTYGEMADAATIESARDEVLLDILAPILFKWFGQEPETLAAGPFQNYIRKYLLKSGRPCYVEEGSAAYLSLDAMRQVYVAMGAIPTYPILGNPETIGEKDIGKLLDTLLKRGVYGFEVIPYRNTRERLREIFAAIQARHLPLFTGTEHNTLDRKPLLDPLSADDEFLPYFERSAYVLLGHQKAVAKDGPEAGFVGPDGEPTMADAKERFEHFERIGRS